MRLLFKAALFVGLIYSSFCVAQTPDIVLQTYVTGLVLPVEITNAGDDRLFVIEKDGRIRIIDAFGNLLPTPFLNIDPRVNSTANERGLLGLAFHPNYSSNGFFYVNYTNNSGHTVISRFSVTANPNVADPNSEVIHYLALQDFNNHNGGDLAFGPDGYLYIPLGDGGSGGDPLNRAQDPMNPLGKMLRIDVDNIPMGAAFGVPPTNPFVGTPGVLDEIWATGLRNPWRFSFDRLTGDIWIGDVGQNLWEEIDFQPASSAGGENYGWRCYEGNNSFNTSGCGPIGNYTFPVHAYISNFPDGCSVTGGFVYRGTAFPNMVGKYFFTDYCTGRFSMIEPNGGGGWTTTFLTDLSNFDYSSFGQDNMGELYVAGLSSGTIFRVTDNSIVLPIRLVRFDAALTDDKRAVQLDWTTESEVNGDYFDVERSLDGKTFTPIGRVETTGETSSGYRFMDEQPRAGNLYYRLKMVDLDGAFEYSSVAAVKVEEVLENGFTLFPNPVRNEVNISMTTNQFIEGQTRLLLFDATGILLRSIEVTSTEQSVYTTNLSAGIHLVILDNGVEQFYRRFVKL